MRQDVYLDEGLKAYIENTAWKNHKRIANFDLEDLIQEGYLSYYKCYNRYVGKRGLRKKDGTPCRYLPVRNPDKQSRSHFMALFKTIYGNRISDLVLKQPKGWELAVSGLTGLDRTEEQFWDSTLPEEREAASVCVLLQTAPREIKELFQVLIGDMVDGYRRFKSGRRRGPRETNNEYFCRLLGVPTYDIVSQVERHFLIDDSV